MFRTEPANLSTRRTFVKLAAQAGFAASMPLWMSATSRRAFAQTPTSYKAIVVVTQFGGNDGNNMIVPLDQATYQEYAKLRTGVALPEGSCIPLTASNGSNGNFGMHPSLSNISQLYNQRKALVVANVGPISGLYSKAQLLAHPAYDPEAVCSHPAGVNQWESATELAFPSTGWGGRIADILMNQSGSLPPVLDVGPASIFTVGAEVQGISVQSGGNNLTPLPSDMSATILAMAQNDAGAVSQLVSQAAQARVLAMQQQAVLLQAQTAGTPLKTKFPSSLFGQAVRAIANIINGRSVVGASRQIFYAQQGSYDCHENQLVDHAGNLSELDGGVGALVTALQEMGLQDQVLICTHSDFNRSYLSNTTGGTDHAWANHHIIVGGGIRGGRILGSIPEPEVGGSADFNVNGIWIPTQSVTQMAAGIGAWMGLSSGQLNTVFPDLANFSPGPISLT